MPITSHYGDSSLVTFLEYGEMQTGGFEKNVQRYLEGQDAYDQWHLAHYMRDYLECLEVSRTNGIHFDRIPRPDKNVLGYLFARSLGKGDAVCELGSTLMEVIDGFQCTHNWISQEYPHLALEHSLKSFHWVGIEISTLFQRAAKLLHPENSLSQVNSLSAYSGPISLLLDRSVSNYCFATASEFAESVNRAEISFLNSYFSLGETFASSRYGKQLNYFSLAEFIQACDLPVFHLYGHQAPRPLGDQDLARGRDVVEGFWFVGDAEVLKTFVETQSQVQEVHRWLQGKEFDVQPASSFL